MSKIPAPRSHRRPLIVWLTILVATSLLSAPAVAEGSAQRYTQGLDTVVLLQNDDGGFGSLASGPNGTTGGTRSDVANLRETAWTVHLMLLEEYDIMEVRTNYAGKQVSLAASHVPNALAWLRDFEVRHASTLDPADRALLALAYQGLADPANSERVMGNVVDEAEGAAAGLALSSLTRIVHVGHTMGFTPANESRNQTWAKLETRAATAAPSTTEQGDDGATAYDLGWLLLATPDSSRTEERRTQLASLLADEETYVSIGTQALASWALAETGGADPLADAALESTHERSPSGAARVMVLYAERAAYPWVSRTIPAETGQVQLDTGAGNTGIAPGQMPSEYQELLAENERLKEELAGSEPTSSKAFPVPAWILAIVILGSLAALVVVSLAYGLKRENLQGPRKSIFNYIESHPGEHFSKIRRDLGMAPGTFQHHLAVLEGEGWITSHKDARYKRYFINGNRYQTLIKGRSTLEYKSKFSALKNPTTRDVVGYLQQHPGATQKQVAQRLNLHASTVNWHAKRLREAGILRGERVGKEVHYRVDDDTVNKLMKDTGNGPSPGAAS